MNSRSCNDSIQYYLRPTPMGYYQCLFTEKRTGPCLQ